MGHGVGVNRCANVQNSIIRGNVKQAISSTITYSNVENGWIGEGNGTLDPEFTDPGHGNYTLKNSSPLIDTGKTVIDVATPANNYFDPPDNLSTPPSPLDRARLPAQGTIKTDIGAYGGPHAGVIGFVQPTVDDPSTPLIREDVIGTY